LGLEPLLRDATAEDKTYCQAIQTLFVATSAFRHHWSCRVCNAAVACETTAAASAVSAFLLPLTPVTLLDLYSMYNTLKIPNLHKYNILLFVHKFFHHPYQLPDIFVSYFTINSEYHGYCTRSKGDPHLELAYSQALWDKDLQSTKGLNYGVLYLNSSKRFRPPSQLKIYFQNHQDV